MYRTSASLAFVLAALSACGSKTDDKPGAAPAPSAAGGAPAATPTNRSNEPVGPGRVTVPDFGVSVEVPDKVRMISGRTNAGEPKASVSLGDDMLDVTRGATASATLEATKTQLAAAVHPMQKVLKETVTEGGWHLEYLALGQVDKNKLYGVEVRTTIGGTPYHCHALTRFHANAPALAAVCDSMKAP